MALVLTAPASGAFFAPTPSSRTGSAKSTKARRIAANRVRDDSLPLNELQAFDMSLFAAP
jgi:hypothetical protein